MPEIEVRPAIASDIPVLIELDHHSTSDHIWQMEFDHDREIGKISANFRLVRLPRTTRIIYPRSPHRLADDWTDRSGLLVALLEDVPIGYASLMINMPTHTAWVTDLVIEKRLRRQGIGSALTLAALEWAHHMDCRRLVLEIHNKNHQAIMMALKLKFEFCGYKDRFFPNYETGLFFDKSVS